MRHLRLVSAAVGFVLLALVPQSVGAAAPLRFPGTPFIGSLVPGTDHEVCPFQVDTAPVAYSQVITVFFDSSGNPTRALFTGRAIIEITNHATGKRIVLNASGPGTLYFQPDGSNLGVGGGPSLFGLVPGDDGGPALLYIKGRVTFTQTPDGHIHNLTTVGPVSDMCAALA
jgi:hypothetical protein